MEVKVIYNPKELEATVDYIAENNSYLLGQKIRIREAIQSCIQDIAKDPTSDSSGTMRFIIIPEWRLEGVDNDQNSCYLKFYVDPNVSYDGENDYVEQIYEN